MAALLEKEVERPDLKNIELPYVVPDKLLMTAGRWNGVEFPAEAIGPEAKRLAGDPDEVVRLFVGAAMDHQDSTGTLVGEVRNFRWEEPTLYGDLVFLVEDAARVAKYCVLTGSKLEGLSPRMETSPEWKPGSGRVDKILRFKSFGIVLDPAQGGQAFLALDEDGREVLDDGLYLLVEEGKGDGNDGSLTEKGVNGVKKLYCEECGILFDEGTEKCDKCGAKLKVADEETIKRLEKAMKPAEDGAGSEEKKGDAKASKEPDGEEGAGEPSEEKKEEEPEGEEEKKDAEEPSEDEAELKADDPEPTYRSRPWVRTNQMARGVGYRRPYYAKPKGQYYKPSYKYPYQYYRAPAMDEVEDADAMVADLVSMCEEIVRRHNSGKLDAGEALNDLEAFLGEVPVSAELSKIEFNGDEAILELIKEKEESEEKLLAKEIDDLEEAGKTSPSMREDAAALMSARTDAVLSKDGKTVDVAAAFRRIVDALPEGAVMTLDEKSKQLVPVDAKLSEDKDLQEHGRKMMKSAGVKVKGDGEK